MWHFAPALRRKTSMFEYLLGAAVAAIIVIYLVYALMRPEQF